VVKLYVEGAARDSALDRSLCRQAFANFFSADPRLKGRLPRTVPCGGRNAAYDAFVAAVRNPEPGVLPLLLVDSETAVRAEQTVWQHLKSRPDDNWDKPEGAGDQQVFLMVQVMESWFIADREALRLFSAPIFEKTSSPPGPGLRKRQNRMCMKR
jgi:hypothetical protein